MNKRLGRTPEGASRGGGQRAASLLPRAAVSGNSYTEVPGTDGHIEATSEFSQADFRS